MVLILIVFGWIEKTFVVITQLVEIKKIPTKHWQFFLFVYIKGKASCLNFRALALKYLQQHLRIRRLKFSVWHVTVGKQRSRLCQRLQSRLFPRGTSFHSPAVALLALWTSLSNRGRKRPSISWLVENIYDWLVPQRLLTGRAPTGKSKTEQNTNDTPSVLVRGYSWDKETGERERDADCILMLEKRHCGALLLSLQSGVSIDPAEKLLSYDFLHAFDHLLLGLMQKQLVD